MYRNIRRSQPSSVAFTVVVFSSLLLLLLLPGIAHPAIPRHYAEDFSTTNYRDAETTTAEWDTVTGQIRVPSIDFEVVGTWRLAFANEAYDVALHGDLAYVVDGAAGLQVIDVRDPVRPARIGSLNTPGTARGVAIAGDYAYVADGATVRVISIQDPATPASAGSVAISGSAASDIAISGDRAYVAAQATGVVVLNISNPAAPSVAATLNTPGSALGVAVTGDLLWVADGASGLESVSIINPSAPVILDTYNTAGSATSVVVDGNVAYVADDSGGLWTIDATVPGSLTLLDRLVLNGNAKGVALDGNYAYVAGGTAGLHKIDVTDPTAMALVETARTMGDAQSVVTGGNYAYVADLTGGFHVLTTSANLTPEAHGAAETTYGATKIKISGDHVFATNAYNGVNVISISDPDSPVLVGSCDTDYAGGMDIAGDYLFVSDHESGMRIINIVNPNAPYLVSVCNTPGNAYDVTVDGDYAFVADQAAGIQVISIANTAAPTIVGSLATTGWAWTVAIDGDIAAVAEYDRGVRIVDLTDPVHPATLDLVGVTGNVTDVAIAGNYVYATAGSSGFKVIDISDPTSAVVVAGLDTPYDASRLTVNGHLLYVANRVGGLQIFDVTDPEAPVLVGSYVDPNSVDEIAVAGEYAYITTGYPDYGVQAIKVRRGPGPLLDRNLAQSIAVDQSDIGIAKIKQSVNAAGSITWEISADAGANWQGVTANNTWQPLTNPGADLLWRATLTTGTSTCTDLALDWVFQSAVFDSIRDIAPDQGGRVRLAFGRSGYDFAGEATPIVGYNVWRRVDDAGLIRAIRDAAASSGGGSGGAGDGAQDFPGVGVDGAGLGLVRVGSGWYMERDRGMPPGTWEILGGFWATQQDQYLYEASTLDDSLNTAFCVTAHTSNPSVWYASPPDSGMSVDNIAPHVPGGFAVTHGPESNSLTWEASPDEDFEYFRVYRGTSPDFPVTPENLVHTTIETGWVDQIQNPFSYSYKLTAVDHAGNESGPAIPETAGVEDGSAGRKVLALHAAVPNPCGPSTSLRFDLPAAGNATLLVYDARGRVVRTLADGWTTAGVHTVIWRGTDEAGRQVPAGIYFLQLVAGGEQRRERLTIIR